MSVLKEYKAVAPQRQTLMSESAVRIDERNKALDVIIKATFIVCEKFKRFSKTAQCLRIKSEPDVVEPQVANVTAALLKQDKATTAQYEAGMGDKWKALAAADMKKVDSKNPEGTSGSELSKSSQGPGARICPCPLNLSCSFRSHREACADGVCGGWHGGRRAEWGGGTQPLVPPGPQRGEPSDRGPAIPVPVCVERHSV
jgi:hypothetical protein